MAEYSGRNWIKYARAIKNQEQLEQLQWRLWNGLKMPFPGRKLNNRHLRRFKVWGRVAALAYLRWRKEERNLR